MQQFKSIPIKDIEQNENSRTVYKAVDTAELMASMKKNGLLQPIGVRKIKNGKYDCVFGNRRVLAAKRLGWDKINANILEDVDEDTDRDILNLVENMKRQNTSVAEDGRMFQTLKDRGLSEDEIAARLDVPKQRVQVALEVLSRVPEEFQKRVQYSTQGKSKRKGGDISASTAKAILNIRRDVGLNRSQMRSMFQYAGDHKPSHDQLTKIGPLVKSGVTIEEAIERVSSMRRITLSVYVPEKHAEKLEAQNKKSLVAVFTEYLEKNSEFKIVTQQPRFQVRLRNRSSALASEASK